MNSKFLSTKLVERCEFRYNVVTSRIEIKEKDNSDIGFRNFTEYDLNTLYIWLKSDGHSITKNFLKDFLNSAIVPKSDPINEYFNNLPVWDGKSDYIGMLANTVKTTNHQYWLWVFKKWFVSFVACALDSNITNQTLLVLVGKQGMGKSTWIDALVPKVLSPYCCPGNINPNDKDSRFKLAECILINLEELGSLRPSQVESIKEFITKPYVNDRRAYGVYSEHYSRRASFIGSTNNHNILADVTGNRRFLIVETTKFESTAHIDLDLVYSQAYSLFKSGFQYWFAGNDITKVNLENENFRQVSHEEVLLMKYFDNTNSKEPVYMNSSEVVQYICKQEKKPFHSLNNVEMGKILTSKGFKTKKIKGIKKYILNQK